MASISLLPVQTGPRGNKSAPLVRGKEPVTATLPATTTPFNASVFGDTPATRLNLELRAGSEAYQSFLDEVDEAVLQALSADTQTYFKKKMTPEDVRAV